MKMRKNKTLASVSVFSLVFAFNAGFVPGQAEKIKEIRAQNS